MWIALVTDHPVWEWLPELTTALRLGSAALGFGIAIHRAVCHWRRNRAR